MAPCKHWMNFCDVDRLSDEYRRGVDEFVKYAFERTGERVEIKCPCVKCKNARFRSGELVKDHLKVYGILSGYTFWYNHGERLGEPHSQCGTCEELGNESDNNENEDDVSNENENEDEVVEPSFNEEMRTMLRDIFRIEAEDAQNDGDNDCAVERSHTKVNEEPNDAALKFYTLFEDFHKPLYEGSKTSRLSAVVNLLHIKTLGRWSNESFDLLLQYLKTQLLPKESTLPDNHYGAKKTISDLGFSYKKIDVCINDCMLFWKEDDKLDYCKVCEACRWKEDMRNGETILKKNGKRIAVKVLRYFPLKPRLQRLFMCSKVAPDMTWHFDKRDKDGVLRHPADAKAWMKFDEEYETFSSEPRNVRLGLISDGFQPFSFSATPYSIWPVMLVPYNLPPWLCMKQSSLMLSMLIPGPKGPGDAIDVYLQPLIEELKELWEEGVETYDASKGENFKMRAALISTINDFPAYGILSGWSTKGKLACPSCHKKTHHKRLSNSSKHVYMRHRRFLPTKHSWRKKKDIFGSREKAPAPQPLSGEEVLEQVKDLEGICLSKDPSKRSKVSHKHRGDNWNKRSVFFELPSWKSLLLRHNLDVMHIEKNVCDIVLGTIMNMKGKTKDTAKARLDMEEMGIMKNLHPIKKGNNKMELPPAPYTLSKNQKDILCRFLKDLKVPDSFSSNISRCVNIKERVISGLKSHDCHVLLENFLPLAIRGLLSKEICEPLIELALFFKVLCAKSLRVADLEQLKEQIPLTLFKLETWLPPSCFDVMLHLVVHLADEAILGGPVHCRWMYPGERKLHTFKMYVRNKARPEGSIAEGYIVDECMTLCSRYLDGIATEFNRVKRNDDGDAEIKKHLSSFLHPGRRLGSGKVSHFDVDEREQAHIYILKNCEEVEPFYKEFLKLLESEALQLTQHEKDVKFPHWFKSRVRGLYEGKNCPLGEELLSLSRGLIQYVRSFSGYVTNGFRFHTLRRSKGLRTQNSGVMVVGNIGDKCGNHDYYGVLTDVVRLEYIGGNYTVLFRCDWFDVLDSRRGTNVVKFGFVSVNTQRLLKTNDPFVLSIQASQVLYVADIVKKGNWQIVLKTQPRDAYLTPTENDDGLEDAYQENESSRLHFVASDASLCNELIDLEESYKEPEIVEIPDITKSQKRKRKSLN